MRVPDQIHLTVFKVDGETNTDDLSPATEAWSRADIPAHAESLLQNRLGPGVAPAQIEKLKLLGRQVAFVGDVVGTGSSRKSATNSLLWHLGAGAVVMARRMAPIFYDTLQDAGALPIVFDGVDRLQTGDHIVVQPWTGQVLTGGGELVGTFEVRPALLEAVAAGGRLKLVLARRGAGVNPKDKGPFTLAQKIVGRACGSEGVAAGTYCEPVVKTVGSQDTMGPLNRQEWEALGCDRFEAELVLQTFCHTAAYPKPPDVETQRTLPVFMAERGAVVLRPGDGIIHSWINRMILPDEIGTGSDSHTRFPLGLSFPAGSGLVAFAAAYGVMPLSMPESVLVRFRGTRRPGITVRDLVHSIPFVAADRSLFNGRILEIEGLEDLSVEEAFEFTDASAERSATAATFSLSENSVASHLRTSISCLRELVATGYAGRPALERRIERMESWLAAPSLLRADAGARYAAVVDIDVADITEPLLACPNDPDDIRALSAVSGSPVDEVFVGSCMTHLSHFESASRILGSSAADRDGEVPVRLWMAPPTRTARDTLVAAGDYSVFGAAGARMELPGCSLCMGNQARVRPGSTVISTSTRNFPNRMGRDARVFLSSAEVATVTATLGRLPSVDEYLAAVQP